MNSPTSTIQRDTHEDARSTSPVLFSFYNIRQLEAERINLDIKSACLAGAFTGRHTHLLLITIQPWLQNFKCILYNLLPHILILNSALSKSLDQLSQDLATDDEPHSVVGDNCANERVQVWRDLCLI
jgi:hypothetical protein